MRDDASRAVPPDDERPEDVGEFAVEHVAGERIGIVPPGSCAGTSSSRPRGHLRPHAGRAQPRAWDAKGPGPSQDEPWASGTGHGVRGPEQVPPRGSQAAGAGLHDRQDSCAPEVVACPGPGGLTVPTTRRMSSAGPLPRKGARLVLLNRVVAVVVAGGACSTQRLLELTDALDRLGQLVLAVGE